jgi:hypothetical protein
VHVPRLAKNLCKVFGKIQFLPSPPKLNRYDMLKWQEEYLHEIQNADNENVLEEYANLQMGDDYDAGCFTVRGKWQYNQVKKELYKRLKEIGFLPNEE